MSCVECFRVDQLISEIERTEGTSSHHGDNRYGWRRRGGLDQQGCDHKGMTVIIRG